MIRPFALAAMLFASCAVPDTRDGGCEESPEALVQAPAATVRSGDASLPVEIADSDEKRMRGLQHRRCDVTGLLLVNEAPGTPLPIWMCEVFLDLDLAFVRDGIVVAVAEAPPCDPPCESCPIYGADVPVDAVLETPAGTFPLQVGDAVEVR